MTKSYCSAILMLLIGSSMILTASSQDQVSQTIYVHEEDLNGTLLSGVQVTGQDAAGSSFYGITDSSGAAVISGQPGTWQFAFTKEGYDPLDLSYDVTETGQGAVYLQRSNPTQEQVSQRSMFMRGTSTARCFRVSRLRDWMQQAAALRRLQTQVELRSSADSREPGSLHSQKKVTIPSP